MHALADFFRAHRKTIIVILGIALIPLIYAGSLVWSNEDPTNRLDQIRAAVVNSDQEATPSAEGAEPVDLGASLTEELVSSDSSKNFDWSEMSAQDAQGALERGEVMAVLDIPAGFSAAAISAGGDDPLAATTARMSITTNDGANIIVGNIASTVGSTVAKTLTEKVSDEYLQNIYVGFTKVHDSLADASDGATKLDDGTATAKSGSADLVVGLQQLSEGGTSLADGTATLADGTRQADAAVQQLSTGATQLDSGAQQLSSGLSQLDQQTAAVPGQLETLSTGADQASSGAQDLADGAVQLETGANDLADGASTLDTGAKTASAGAATLATGVDDALAGAKRLQEGATPLATGTTALSEGLDTLLATYDALPEADRKAALAALAANADALESGAAQLDVGATQLVGSAETMPPTGLSALQSGAAELKSGTAELATGAGTLSSGASTLATKTTELATGAGTLSTGASAVAGGVGTLETKFTELVTAIGTASDGASTLASGTGTLSSGASTLAQSTPKLVDGADQASDGATKLADGAGTAESGGEKLDDGLGDLKDGSSELASGLSDGVDDVPTYTDAEKQHLAEVASAPVQLDKERLNEVPAYGYGLAPYFMTLGLWVGALAYYLMFPPLRERLVEGRQPAVLVALRSFGPGALVAAFQSLFMLAIVRFGIGLEPANMLGMVGLALLTSATFIAINQALNALLGAPGRFFALILIVLQLSSAGGTYPVETSPSFFQALHDVLPLTYSVNAFRSLVAGGDIGIAPAFLVLPIWLAGALLVTTLAVLLKRRRARLAPTLSSPSGLRTPSPRGSAQAAR